MVAKDDHRQRARVFVRRIISVARDETFTLINDRNSSYALNLSRLQLSVRCVVGNETFLEWHNRPRLVQTRHHLVDANVTRVFHFVVPCSLSTNSTISRRFCTTASSSMMASAANSWGSGSSSLSSSDSSLSQVMSSL